MKTILLQSHRPPPWPGWIVRCLKSAREWARGKKIPTLFLHDELFDGLPAAFMAATENEVLPRTDLGRLLWIKRLHDQGWERVIWLDADIFVFDHSLSFDGDVVGKEAWITHATTNGLRVMKKVNNCAMCFDAGSPHLKRYLAAVEAKAAEPGPPGRLDFGPDLMSRLHAEEPFPLHPDIAMISPRLMNALAGDWAPARQVHQQVWGGAPKAANLCGSLETAPDIMIAAMETLKADATALTPNGPVEPFETAAPWRDAPVLW